MNTIGNNIKRLRKVNKMSQKDLADKLNVQPTAVSAWEVGRSKPLMDNIEKMAIIFGVSKTEIISDFDLSISKRESNPVLNENQVALIIKQAEELYGVSLHNDPDVLEATKQLIHSLAKMKAAQK